MHRICPYCRKPIVLEPSANERAQRYGGRPSDYIDLFPYHADCFTADRSRQSSELMASMSFYPHVRKGEVLHGTHLRKLKP